MNVIGKQIGNHLLVELINNGTYGSVYRANHAKLSELVVAVKLLRGYLDLDPVQARDMFLKEARMLAVLKHRHILPVHDVGFSNELELPYIVVEYAPGGSLRDRLKKRAGNPFFSE